MGPTTKKTKDPRLFILQNVNFDFDDAWLTFAIR